MRYYSPNHISSLAILTDTAHSISGLLKRMESLQRLFFFEKWIILYRNLPL
jgi:hypothetical protein